MVSDFELALIQATAINFPNANHKGCYYHFKQGEKFNPLAQFKSTNLVMRCVDKINTTFVLTILDCDLLVFYVHYLRY